MGIQSSFAKVWRAGSKVHFCSRLSNRAGGAVSIMLQMEEGLNWATSPYPLRRQQFLVAMGIFKRFGFRDGSFRPHSPVKDYDNDDSSYGARSTRLQRGKVNNWLVY